MDSVDESEMFECVLRPFGFQLRPLSAGGSRMIVLGADVAFRSICIRIRFRHQVTEFLPPLDILRDRMYGISRW